MGSDLVPQAIRFFFFEHLPDMAAVGVYLPFISSFLLHFSHLPLPVFIVCLPSSLSPKFIIISCFHSDTHIPLFFLISLYSLYSSPSSNPISSSLPSPPLPFPLLLFSPQLLSPSSSLWPALSTLRGFHLKSTGGPISFHLLLQISCDS